MCSEFLTDCSVEFEAHDTDINTLQSEVSSMTDTVDDHATNIATLQDDMSSVTTTVDGHVTDIAALEAAVVQLMNASTADADAIGGIQEELQLIHDQLDRIGHWDLGSAAVVGGDWQTAVDTNAVTDTMMRLTAKDLAILALLAVTLVLITALCMGCNQRSGGRKKYEPVSIVSE